MELQDITEALNGNAELLTGITNHILDSDKGKEIISNRAENIYQEKIGGEVSEIHKRYDEDMFTILGERPGTLEDGGKQKTYEKIKSLYTELADLRKKKDSLSKDEAIKALNTQIEDLKKNGPGAHWEQTFKKEQSNWKTERETLLERATEAETKIVTFQKRTDIEAGLRDLKFNDDVPEAARKALVNNVVNSLVKNSKIDGDKIVYLDENGAQINDNEYKPMTASGILKDALKDILKNENTDGGGGAPTTVSGSIETTSVDGKDVKKLNLQEGSFKTKTEFLSVAEEALIKSGVTRGSADWDKLKNEAYNRYNVSKLPR